MCPPYPTACVHERHIRRIHDQPLREAVRRGCPSAWDALQGARRRAAVARHGKARVGVFLGTSTAGILETELAYRRRDPAALVKGYVHPPHHRQGGRPLRFLLQCRGLQPDRDAQGFVGQGVRCEG